MDDITAYSLQKGLQLLIIDDMPTNIRIAAFALKEQGYTILAAGSGQQGIAIAQAKQPDLILLDIMMPEMDGYEVCRILKQDKITADIPIIFLTASNDTDSIVKGFDLGAADYIAKPFNPAELVARVKAHLEIRRQKKHIRILSMAVEQSTNSIIITETSGKIIFVNQQFLKTTGYDISEIIGRNLRMIKSDNQPKSFYKEMWETILSGREWQGEFQNKKKNGELYWELSTINSIRDDKGNILYFLAIQKDITEKKKAEQELYYYSTTDCLTNMYNRRTGLEMLKQQLLLAERQNQKLTISFIDLNGLKFVNDTYGHAEGDRYITLISDHIREVIRKSDTPVRLGGDEFLIILPDCEMEEAKRVLNRLNETLEQVNRSGQYRFTASVSCGFAEYDPRNPPDHDALIAAADNEMYQHKVLHKQGRTS